MWVVIVYANTQTEHCRVSKDDCNAQVCGPFPTQSEAEYWISRQNFFPNVETSIVEVTTPDNY